MSEEIALPRGIARSPDDAAARLVYADWLDDHGRPQRAEFIRAQVELAGILRATPPLDADALSIASLGFPSRWVATEDSTRQREAALLSRRLLDAHERDWLLPLSRLLRREWSWSGGFDEVVDADPAVLADFGEEVFDLHPI